MSQHQELSATKQLVCIAGLPRAGSTLLCQLLGQHPQIYSPGNSSPLPHSLSTIRSALSNDQFLLSQLDHEFTLVYQRLQNAYRGFINGWFAETERPIAVDKNRAWLGLLDVLIDFNPEFRVIVCIRELSQIYGSLEAQHQKTRLMDSEDGFAGLTPLARAAHFFNEGGAVGRGIMAIQAAMEDYPQVVRDRILYVRFEDLVNRTPAVFAEILGFIGCEPLEIDLQHLSSRPQESDSHYRWKYRHNTHSCILPPQTHTVPDRITQYLQNLYPWWYERFYS